MPAFICGIFVARYARARRRNDNIMFHLSRAARNDVSKFNQRTINVVCARVGARVLHDVPRGRAVPPLAPHRVPNPTSVSPVARQLSISRYERMARIAAALISAILRPSIAPVEWKWPLRRRNFVVTIIIILKLHWEYVYTSSMS